MTHTHRIKFNSDVTLIILIFAVIFSILLPVISSALASDDTVSIKYCINGKQETGEACHWCEYLDGAAILFAVVLVVFITAYNDYKKEQKFRGLQEKVEDNQVFTGLFLDH